MLEDRPPGNEQRLSFSIDILKLTRWLKDEKEMQSDDSNNSVSNIKCLTGPAEIDKRINDILAAGNGSRNRGREEEYCPGSSAGSSGE